MNSTTVQAFNATKGKCDPGNQHAVDSINYEDVEWMCLSGIADSYSAVRRIKPGGRGTMTAIQTSEGFLVGFSLGEFDFSKNWTIVSFLPDHLSSRNANEIRGIVNLDTQEEDLPIHERLINAELMFLASGGISSYMNESVNRVDCKTGEKAVATVELWAVILISVMVLTMLLCMLCIRLIPRGYTALASSDSWVEGYTR